MNLSKYLDPAINNRRRYPPLVMPGLVPGIYVLKQRQIEGVDGRDKPGHDGQGGSFSRGLGPWLTDGLRRPLLRRDMAIRLGGMIAIGVGVMIAAMRVFTLHP